MSKWRAGEGMIILFFLCLLEWQLKELNVVTVKAKLLVSDSGRQEQHCPLRIILLSSLLFAGRGAAHKHKGVRFGGIDLVESIFHFFIFFVKLSCIWMDITKRIKKRKTGNLKIPQKLVIYLSIIAIGKARAFTDKSIVRTINHSWIKNKKNQRPIKEQSDMR